ncbi:MAG: hypothetical protein NTZ74_05145 [Chloroflexi bacterium]|nr:hypothetical protein [Chloroflexota bacterium]
MGQKSNANILPILFLYCSMMAACGLSKPLHEQTNTVSPTIETIIEPYNTPIITSSEEPQIFPTQTLTQTPVPISSWNQGKIAYLTTVGSKSILNLFDLTNYSTTQLASTNDELGFLGLSFSLDGNYLAYYAYPKDMYVIQTGMDHYSQYVANCQAPSFSRDGSQIICVSPELRIILINSANGSLIKQINQSKPAGLVDFSKVNDQIVFTVRDEKNTQIWKTSINSEEPVLLAGDATENYVPTWSPDGNYIAYQSNDGSTNSEIWIMDSDGNNKQRITYSPNNGWSRGPAWSPDGQYLAYVSNQNGSIDPDMGEVFIVSVVTREVSQLTNTGGKVYDWKVAWGR